MTVGQHGGMDALVIPQSLAEAASRDTSPERREWVAALPVTVAELARRWTLRVGEPFQPGGQCSWTAPAVDRHGHERVLKVGWWHTEAMHEADALRLWAGDGAVMVHAAYASGQTSALLLEGCVPGTTLKRTTSEPEQDAVVAGLLRRLWREPAAGHPFRSLQSMCDWWADEFEAKVARAPRDPLDPGIVRAGTALFRELPATADRNVVLCTDLHGDNILAAEREPWLVIDPKPYVGDPTYDPLQHMLNCPDRLVADPAGFARRMADLLDLDAERLTRWLFARCVQESFDIPGAREAATRLAP